MTVRNDIEKAEKKVNIFFKSVLLGVMVIGLAACGSQPQGTGSAVSAAETENPESGPAAADIGDAAGGRVKRLAPRPQHACAVAQARL